MDVNDTERELQDAFNAREEKAFGVALDKCNDFMQIFHFTTQCAEFALRTSWPLEKNTLQNMMQRGLKRMCALHQNWSEVLGSDVEGLWNCLRVIENFKFPGNRNTLLEFRAKADSRSPLLGYLLWGCCKDVTESKEFPKINEFIFNHSGDFLRAMSIACTAKKFGDYFSFLKRHNGGVNRSFSISMSNGRGMLMLFHYWRENKQERETLLKAIEECNIPADVFRDTRVSDAEFFQEACKAGATYLVRILLVSCGPKVLPDGQAVAAALCLASEYGYIEIVRLLLAQGADVNEGWRKFTPLMYASMNGHINVVRLLLKSGANVAHKNKQGETALHVASTVEVVDVLLENGADLEGITHEGLTVLHCASQYGHVAVVRQWLEMGIDIDINYAGGWRGTPLIIASEKGHVEVVRLLLGFPEIIYLNVGLLAASQNGHAAVVRLFLENGGDVNYTISDTTALSLLHIASEKGHVEVIRVLLEYGADVNKTAKNGVTPLFVAAQHGHDKAALLLLENGALVHTLVWRRQSEFMGVAIAREFKESEVWKRMQRCFQGKSDTDTLETDTVAINALDIAFFRYGERSEICQALIEKELEQKAQRKQTARILIWLQKHRYGIFGQMMHKDTTRVVARMVSPPRVRGNK